jgi:hypothetical protein
VRFAAVARTIYLERWPDVGILTKMALDDRAGMKVQNSHMVSGVEGPTITGLVGAAVMELVSKCFFRKRLSNERACEIGKAVCAEEGWPFFPPVVVVNGFRSWTIFTNADGRGCNAAVKIRKKDGAVLKKVFVSNW